MTENKLEKEWWHQFFSAALLITLSAARPILNNKTAFFYVSYSNMI